MVTFKLSQRSQSIQVLVETDGNSSIERAHITNGVHGWQARKVEKTDRVSSLGPIYAPVGEAISVSKLVNQRDGANQIAAKLGL